MAKISILVNGKRHRVQAAPDTPLLYVLRNDLDLHAPRFGCGLAQCGACTVHIDGEAVRSCILPVGAARGKQVTTLEALASEKNPHPVVTAFIEEDAAQCGYCINGMVMQSVAFLPSTTHDRPRPRSRRR